jgi:hypothetical protein
MDFEEDLSLRQLTGIFAGARLSAQKLYLPIEPAGGVYVYPFGATVTCDTNCEEPAMDRIYDGLRAEFDLADRYAAMESKLRSIREALELGCRKDSCNFIR